MANVTVEFLGIPRERAGCDQLQISAKDVGKLLDALVERLPEFAAACLHGNSLRSEYLICVNGQKFTRDGSHPLSEGDEILILSADVGG